MLIDIEKIKVGNRIRKDFGDISELAEDIKQNGLINPPVINKDYELLAGERRLRACKSLGWNAIPVNMMDTRDAEHELNIEISENDVRKGFTKSERVDYMKRLLKIEEVKAKERQTLGEKSHEGGRADEITAEKFDISSNTMRKEITIADNRELLDPKDFADWDEGKLSTNKAYQKIKNELDLARANLTIAENEVSALKNKPPKEIVKEVVKEVIPADYNDLKRKAQIAQNDFRNMQNLYEEMADKWKAECLKNQQAEEKAKEPEVQFNRKIKLDAMGLCAGVSNFLESYGGYTYLMSELNRLSDIERKGVTSAITAISRWADDMLNISVSEVIENE